MTAPTSPYRNLGCQNSRYLAKNLHMSQTNNHSSSLFSANEDPTNVWYGRPGTPPKLIDRITEFGAELTFFSRLANWFQNLRNNSCIFCVVPQNIDGILWNFYVSDLSHSKAPLVFFDATKLYYITGRRLPTRCLQ